MRVSGRSKLKRSVRLCALVACFCAMGLRPARAAVSDYIGKPIGSVTLAIEDRETRDTTLIAMVETTVGQPLAMASVRESITHLFSLGRFEDVRVDASLENGKVALRYALSPVHPITRIRFDGPGGPDVDERAMRRAMLDRYGATPPLARAPDMTRIVEGVLAQRGYLHPTIASRSRVSHDPEQAELTFTITPNKRTTIGAVEITGTPSLPAPELLRRLGLVRSAPFQRDILNANIERYITERRSRGYYEAQLVPVITLADDDRVADVTIDVRPGPLVRVVFTGDDVPASRRAELVPVEREGAVDEDLLEDSSNRIEDMFRAQGYRNATAPHTRDENDGELVITFAVKKGPLSRVASYEISSNISISTEELAPLLRLHTGQPFVENRLETDVSVIEAVYHRRGFASARARSAVDPQTKDTSGPELPVAVRIDVSEGPQTTVESVTIDGGPALDPAKLREALKLQAGRPYVPNDLIADRDAIQQAYQNLGYQGVRVTATPQFSPDGTRASFNFQIDQGQRVIVDHVLIVGNVRTRTDIIERELRLKAGDPYNVSAIDESQRRLVSLGLFRRVRISELRHGAENTRDVLVTVEEAPPTTISYGVGAEAGPRLVEGSDGQTNTRFDVAPRALFEIGRRNLFGKNRSVDLFMSVGRTVVTSLTEYRVVATFREPKVFDTSADAFLNGTLEQQHRSSFDFARRSLSANVERRFKGPYRVTGTYQLQRTRVFNLPINDPDLPLIDRTFPQFLLSSFSASLIRDTRDDQVDAHRGTYLSANGQVAASAFGSEVGFVKSFFTAELFRTIPRTNGIVFAGDARLGVANGHTADGTLPASERFFAGGDTTVRGFTLDQLGVRHFPSQANDTVDPNGFAIGGNALVIFNAEMRVPVRGGLGVVGFVDTGNVFSRASTIDLAELRSAAGVGIRYKSPVGPLRIDLGFKLNRQPGESLTAWFVSFGQAF